MRPEQPFIPRNPPVNKPLRSPDVPSQALYAMRRPFTISISGIRYRSEFCDERWFLFFSVNGAEALYVPMKNWAESATDLTDRLARDFPDGFRPLAGGLLNREVMEITDMHVDVDELRELLGRAYASAAKDELTHHAQAKIQIARSHITLGTIRDVGLSYGYHPLPN